MFNDVKPDSQKVHKRNYVKTSLIQCLNTDKYFIIEIETSYNVNYGLGFPTFYKI